MRRRDRPLDRRWREGAGDSVDGRIGALLRQVSNPAPWSAESLDALGAAIASGAPRRRRRRRLVLRWVLVAGMVLGVGGVVFARHGIARMFAALTGRTSWVAPTPPVSTDRRRSAAVSGIERTAPSGAPNLDVAGAPARSGSPGEQRVPLFNGASESRAHEPRQPQRRAKPDRAVAANRLVARVDLDDKDRRDPAAASRANETAGAASIPMPPPPMTPPPTPWPSSFAPAAPAPPVTGLADEARLVRQALQELRHDHDPQGALALLDEHRTRHANGVLRADADLLRVEALLALRRDRDALALLEQATLEEGPRAAELRTTRGELRATRDCRAALADFDHVLARRSSAALTERALRGRAACWLRLGDRAAASEALRVYLDRFPRGGFADEARRRLHAM